MGVGCHTISTLLVQNDAWVAPSSHVQPKLAPWCSKSLHLCILHWSACGGHCSLCTQAQVLVTSTTRPQQRRAWLSVGAHVPCKGRQVGLQCRLGLSQVLMATPCVVAGLMGPTGWHGWAEGWSRVSGGGEACQQARDGLHEKGATGNSAAHCRQRRAKDKAGVGAPCMSLLVSG